MTFVINEVKLIPLILHCRLFWRVFLIYSVGFPGTCSLPGVGVPRTALSLPTGRHREHWLDG